MATQPDDEILEQLVEDPSQQQLDQVEQLYREPDMREMRKLRPADFEQLVACVLRHAGFKVKHTGLLFRRGVDLEIFSPQANAQLTIGGVECKRYNRAQPVGRDPVQKLAGAAALTDLCTEN